MATRQGDSEALVARVRKLESMGWRVEDATDGWKIFDRRDNMFTVHKTYSDHRSLTNNIKELEGRGGLKADEAEMRRNRMAERRRALAADREASDRRAMAIAAQQQGMLVKAAGPYMAEIEECDLEWMIGEHPAPWMRWMYLTPKAAQFIIDHHNTDNRKHSQDQVERYKAIIVSDQWHLTHQGIAFDTRRLVQDGGHRARAVAELGEEFPDLKVPFAVFVGMPVENFKAIDEGRLRTAAQMLSKAGIAGGTHVVTMLRTVAAFDTPNPRGYTRRDKLTNVQAFDLIGKDPDGYATAMAVGNRGYKKTRITPGIMASAYYLIARVNGFDNAYVTAFFEGLIANRKHNTDRVLPDDDPRKVLLTRYSNVRPRNPVDGASWIITAWNNICKGNHPRTLRVTDDIPQPLKIVPGHGAIPRALVGEIDILQEVA